MKITYKDERQELPKKPEIIKENKPVIVKITYKEQPEEIQEEIINEIIEEQEELEKPIENIIIPIQEELSIEEISNDLTKKNYILNPSNEFEYRYNINITDDINEKYKYIYSFISEFLKFNKKKCESYLYILGKKDITEENKNKIKLELI